MDNRIKIRDCIQAGRISEATALVHQLHPELLDDDRYLFFHLQVPLSGFYDTTSLSRISILPPKYLLKHSISCDHCSTDLKYFLATTAD